MEIQWTYSALLLLPEDTALQMEQAFEQGGMWSPETLIFILHLSVILCTGILLLSFFNSLPSLRMNLRRHTGLFAAAIGGAAVSMAAFAVTAPGYVDPDTAARPDAASIETDAARSFGMASRSAEQFGVTGYFANARHSDATAAATGAMPEVGGAATVAAADTGGGAALFGTHCAACHGADGQGVEGLGLNLVASSLVADSSEAALQAFLRKGRMPGDPGSVTGVPMPAFAWMSPEQLQQVAAYVKGRATP
jgi:mono/diheme cytochrome c family protein